ncbi:AMP-dependent synthetase/ligase [Trema orientale]|uniref:AMP-dependent synthetase/ligase n=1 Tax=Trema orientale TaxID=63057 RepID=A0A2P5EL43_TREOI|nr:AMP-dependent synthetase/ligase [Trema orientale]
MEARVEPAPGDGEGEVEGEAWVGKVALTKLDVVDLAMGASMRQDGSSLREVVLRGGSVMLRYVKDPEGTTKLMSGDRWFYTRNVGMMHPDGYLEKRDRSKDVIISGGENLSSVEVESVLYGFPAINEEAKVAPQNESSRRRRPTLS